MTRSKIQRIKFFVFLYLFLLAQIASCDGSAGEKRQDAESVPTLTDKDKKVEEKLDKVIPDKSKDAKGENAQVPVIAASLNNHNKLVLNITSKSNPGAPATTVLPSTSTIQSVNGAHLPSMNSGALMRGVFVAAGLSVLFMAYMVFRSFRFNKSRAQMVRKYGVLAHRQDVEMRPLPLDEDDEDDTTVFDATSIPSHRLQT